MWTTVHCTIIF